MGEGHQMATQSLRSMKQGGRRKPLWWHDSDLSQKLHKLESRSSDREKHMNLHDSLFSDLQCMNSKHMGVDHIQGGRWGFFSCKCTHCLKNHPVILSLSGLGFGRLA
mmetsp:Transcript_80257/g.139178  ORF Transcript_80257/g.139178 Transcript_80257/m.139178 type:complete len:107 (-) Transcript_80257:146-466(-)